jgi:hypothetical protein
MSYENLRKNKRTAIINEIIKTKENKKTETSDNKKLFNIYVLIDYNDSIFKKEKEIT